MREGHKNFNYLCGHGQLINRVGPKCLHASKSLTVKACIVLPKRSLIESKQNVTVIDLHGIASHNKFFYPL